MTEPINPRFLAPFNFLSKGHLLEVVSGLDTFSHPHVQNSPFFLFHIDELNPLEELLFFRINVAKSISIPDFQVGFEVLKFGLKLKTDPSSINLLTPPISFILFEGSVTKPHVHKTKRSGTVDRKDPYEVKWVVI